MGYTVIANGRRRCIVCASEKPVSDFASYSYKTKQGKLSRRHSSRCKDCERVRRVARHEQQREKSNAQSRAWKESNRDRVQAYAREYFSSEHGRRVKAFNQKRRAHRHKSAEGTYTKADIDALFRAQRGKCAYCRQALAQNYTIDHIQALSRGGTNWPKNLQLACVSCNSSKQAKDPIVFAQSVGLLL